MAKLPTEAEPVRVVESDALAFLRSLPDGCADAVVTDPPYPEISREYGRWTEAEWFALMNPVVEECRRVLKASGSAVFVLQPNSERVGRMRTWLWRFMCEWGERWGIVQDAWWWNHCAIPQVHAIHGRLMRPSLKACVWLGPPDCYRDQDAILWGESQENAGHRASAKAFRVAYPSGHGANARKARDACIARGGTTPFNVIPVGANHANGASNGHGASTPMPLARWWVRYICPPGGLVLDPFLGSGTTAVAAVQEGRRCMGSERFPKYVPIARRRVAEALGTGLFAGATA